MEVTHDMGNMFKHVESLVNMALRQFGIVCRGVVITEQSI
jgi:hypothetical protein